MKEEANNEIDLMLRRFGRTSSSSYPENGDSGSTAEGHLDVDELNAYAENDLPQAARARYTEHLADCNRCRQIVSQLNQAAGLVFEEKAVPQPAVSGLRKFISSFFSPMVLRYAIPALGLILVALLGLFRFRQMSPLRETALTKSASPVAQQSEAATPAFVNKQTSSPANAGEPPRSDVSKNKVDSPKDENMKRGLAEEDSTKTSKASEPAGQTGAATDKVAVAQNAPAPVAEAPKAKDTSGDKKTVSGDVADRKSQVVAAAPASISSERQEKELSKMRDNEAGARAAGGFAAAPSKGEVNRTRVKREGLEEKPAEGRGDKYDSDSRSVSGRQFRRQGSIWIDVAYDSRATIDVARGSEQYRALIADEPSIKTIADQLGGEIIVMWKNRAYRIR
jgi:hypothetical protein